MKTLEVNIKKMTGINKCEVIVVTSVEHITRDVNFGWLLRYCHQVGASMFFVVVYIHIFQQETYHEFFFKKKKSIYHIICYAFSSNSFWVFCIKLWKLLPQQVIIILGQLALKNTGKILVVKDAILNSPFSIRYLTVSVGPLLAAKCSGVQVQHYEKLHLRLVKLLF